MRWLNEDSICKYCSSLFRQKHFNQTLCSDVCRLHARRVSKRRHKLTEKGIATESRWIGSERRKANERGYRKKPQARKKAVARVLKYHEQYEYARIGKRQSDRIFSASERGKAANRIAGREYRRRKKLGIPSRSIKATERLDPENSFTASEWQEKLEEHGYACAHCGVTADLTMDHVTPLSKGGRNTIENIQVLCRACNSSKGNRLP